MSPKYWPRENPLLYEINTAAWLCELSQKLGRTVFLKDVPTEEWDRLKALGIDFIWLMGAWTRSQEGRQISLNSPHFHETFQKILPSWTPEDIIGSGYSVQAYTPDPLIGRWDDLDSVHRELNRRGMGLILDFIPNHTGIDHHWLTEHPEYYIQGKEADYLKDPQAYFPVQNERGTYYIAHGRDPNFPPWTDTAQLNYFNPDLRAAMIGRIREISRYCDGIRCDMAMLELNEVVQRVWGQAQTNGEKLPSQEFWLQAIQEIPDLIYIAEAYWDTEWTLQQLGFDFTYDKRLYDRMRSGHPHDVYLHLTAGLDYQKKMVRFIENHDELRSVMAFGRSKAPAVAVLSSTLPGMKLFFHGQWEGKQIHLPIQIRQCRMEKTDTQIKAFYETLLAALNEEIFHRGTWQLQEVSSDGDSSAENLIAHTWEMEGEMRLVLVNLNQHPARGLLHLRKPVEESRDYSFTEIFSRQVFCVNGKRLVHPGVPVSLTGYQAQIFKIRPVKY